MHCISCNLIIFQIGESTAAGRVLGRDHFGDKLKDLIKGKLTPKPPAVWGTCSGLIMLANELENQKQGGQYHVSFLKKIFRIFLLG